MYPSRTDRLEPIIQHRSAETSKQGAEAIRLVDASSYLLSYCDLDTSPALPISNVHLAYSTRANHREERSEGDHRSLASRIVATQPSTTWQPHACSRHYAQPTNTVRIIEVERLKVGWF